MPRRKTNEHIEKPFVSIEEDSKLMRLEVQLKGMSIQKATRLVDEIRKLGLEADAVPKRNTGHVRQSRGYTPASKRNAIEDARYHVRVTLGGVTMEIENSQQWDLYKRLYPMPVRATVSRHNDSDFEDRLREATGLGLSDFVRLFNTKASEHEIGTEDQDDSRYTVDLALFEGEMSDNDAWEVA